MVAWLGTKNALSIAGSPEDQNDLQGLKANNATIETIPENKTKKNITGNFLKSRAPNGIKDKIIRPKNGK